VLVLQQVPARDEICSETFVNIDLEVFWSGGATHMKVLLMKLMPIINNQLGMMVNA
jgi:hypothetical protein